MKMSDVFNLPLRAVEPKDIGTGKGAYPVMTKKEAREFARQLMEMCEEE